MLALGQAVLLVDGRGCHVEHRLTRGDKVVGAVVILRGQTWRNLAFTLSGEHTVEGFPVLRAGKPAIAGAAGDDRIYIPEGWSAPAELPARLAKEP